MKIRRTPAKKVRLSDACHTSQADIERIVNQAQIPAGTTPGWRVETRATPKRTGRRR